MRTLSLSVRSSTHADGMCSLNGNFWEVAHVGMILEYIVKGGVHIMVPLLALFMIGLAYIIERFFALGKAKINTAEFLTKIRAALRSKNVKEAVKICETFKGPIASILKTGLMKYGDPKEEIEKTMENAAMHEIARLERGLPVLSTISNPLSPNSWYQAACWVIHDDALALIQ